MSYIDKEKALEFVLNNTPHINGETTMKCVERVIKEIPTADVVEVVRCRDCRLRDTEECPMMVWDVSGMLMGDNEDNDYCSYGERREQ